MAKKKGNAIRPVGAKILVKRVSAEEKTQGGIIIPDSSQEKPLDLSYNSCVDKNTLFNKRERRNAIYDNTNKFD